MNHHSTSTLSKFFFCICISFISTINSSYSQYHEWSYDCGKVTVNPTVTIDSLGNVFLLARLNGSVSTPAILGSFLLTHPADLIKFDNHGNVIWAMDDVFQTISPSDGGRNIATFTLPNQQTGFYVAGCISPGIPHLYPSLACYDESCNLLWQRSGNGDAMYSIGTAVAVDHDGNIYMAGHFDRDSLSFGNSFVAHTPVQGSEIFIVKYNSNGNVLWAQNAGASDCDIQYIGIHIDNQNSAYVTFSSQDFSVIFGNDTITNYSPIHPFLLKFDLNGNKIWGRTIEGIGGSLARDSYIDASGSVAIVGNYTLPINLPSINGSGFMVVKYDNNGNILWANGGNASGSHDCNSVSVDALGNTYISGWFCETHLYFDSIPFANYDTTSVNRSANVSDNFYAMFDVNGNFTSAYVFGGITGGGQKTYSMTSDNLGNTFLTGDYKSPFVIIGNDTLSDGSGDHKLFITKFSSQPTAINDIFETNAPSLFPNPANDFININADGFDGKISILIYDVFGKIVYDNHANNYSVNNKTISMKSYAPGIYFISLANERKRYVYRIVKS